MDSWRECRNGGRFELFKLKPGGTVMQLIKRKSDKDQEGITGIETAIILIAFVIVASVFAYVVLSAGLFSTQKAKEAIHAGLEEARCTIEVKGNMYGLMQAGVLQEVYFTVGTTTGGDSIDFTDTSGNSSNLVVISYTDAYQMFPTVNWTLTKLNTVDTDNMLDDNELFMITVDLTVVSLNATPEQLPGPYHTFQLELKPPTGAVLVLERTLPARVDQIVNLY
jgi:archaeal flagellin FlaB